MANSIMNKLACLILITFLLSPAANAVAPPQISCGTVTNSLAPCLEFIVAGGVIAANCCNGVKALYAAANTTPKRRQVCACLKQVTQSASPTFVQHAKEIPSKCGLSLPYVISPAINCKTVI